MHIVDLMGDSNKIEVVWSHTSSCPSCLRNKGLLRITIGQDIYYACIDCFRAAINIIQLKQRLNQ